MTLEHCGVVDSEDGLLLFGDAAVLQLWPGTDGEQVLFAQIESAFRGGAPGLKIPVAHETAVIWDLEGPGTTDIFSDPVLSRVMLVRSWLVDPLDSGSEFEAVLTLDTMPFSLNVCFAEFQIESGTLAILWPTESGDCIHDTGRTDYTLQKQELMTESSGLLLRVLNGRYQCFHDDVQTQHGEARRCHIVKMESG